MTSSATQPARPGTGRVTLADVAQKAGFSRSTASLVFQDSPLVADSTRETVMAAARALGYVYDRRAASFRKQRSNTVGLVIGGLSNPFFGDLSEPIEEQLAELGYTVLLGNTLEDLERQSALITTLSEYRVDGVIIVPAIGSTASSVEPLQRLGIPTVLLTRRVSGLDAPYVGIDDRRAGCDAAQHLIDHGCTSIAYFGGREGVYARSERLGGVRSTCEQNGADFDPTWTVEAKTSSVAGYQQMTRLLSAGHEPPQGMVFHSDAVAFGAMRALREHNFRVGEDIRVVGFDDVELAPLWSPSLTSMTLNAEDLGRSAVETLTALMSGRPSVSDTVARAVLTIRESCGVEPR